MCIDLGMDMRIDVYRHLNSAVQHGDISFTHDGRQIHTDKNAGTKGNATHAMHQHAHMHVHSHIQTHATWLHPYSCRHWHLFCLAAILLMNLLECSTENRLVQSKDPSNVPSNSPIESSSECSGRSTSHRGVLVASRFRSAKYSRHI